MPNVEEHKKGKKTEPAIDAIAEWFAIEHTSIDTLDGQREADAPFMDWVFLEALKGLAGMAVSLVSIRYGMRTLR